MHERLGWSTLFTLQRVQLKSKDTLKREQRTSDDLNVLRQNFECDGQRLLRAGMNAQQHIASSHLRASLGDLIAADGEIDRIGGFGAAGTEFEDDVADAARVHAM